MTAEMPSEGYSRSSSTTKQRKQGLRDHLLSSLSGLPSPERLGLTVLTSSPKRNTTLFPYAAHPPKCFEKEYFVTIASDMEYTPTTTTSTASRKAEHGDGSGASGSEEGAVAGPSSTTISPVHSSDHASTAASSSSPKASIRPVMVVALHAYLYTIPSTSTSILYISKVDTSGYAPSPLPLTRYLLVSFLRWHLDKETRPSENVQVALFARSQGQYLFPNSARAKGKRVSGGLRLCGWWKGVFEEVAAGLWAAKAHRTSEELGAEIEQGRGKGELALRYTLPSYSAQEAMGMLGLPKRALPSGLEWKYAPPFSRNVFDGTPGSSTSSSSSSSTAAPSMSTSNIAWSIPCLPDDPKTRFLDELVSDLPALTNNETRHQARTSAQEGETKPQTLKEREKLQSEKERRACENALRKMSTEEFWERMGFRQECSSGDVTGFFHLDSAMRQGPDQVGAKDVQEKGKDTDGAAGAAEIKVQIVDRIHQALLNTDFGTVDYAVKGSEIWRKSVEGLVVGEIGQEGYERCIGTVPAKVGLVGKENGKKEEAVTMLQPRKRKAVDGGGEGGGGGVNTLQPRRKEVRADGVNVLQPKRK